MKRYVDSSKSKKASKSTKANTMKPQTATNGLKRPLPSTASVEDAKRMNIDSSATAINIKKETEVKSEPKSDTSDNNMVGGANTGNAILPPISVANQANPGSTEVKQESSDAANVANHSNNDVSLNDFELDLENTDFQVCKISLYFFVTHTHRLTRDTLELTKLCSKVGRSFITLSYFAKCYFTLQDLIQDITDLNPDMLDFEFNDKNDFDDLGASIPPTTAASMTSTASNVANSVSSNSSIANSGPPPRTTSADLSNSSNNPGNFEISCLFTLMQLFV